MPRVMPYQPGQPQRQPPRGGGDPAAQEVVLNGPFKGFDSDAGGWFIGDGGILDDCQNADFLKGQVQTRPGTASVISSLSAVTIGGGTAAERYTATGNEIYGMTVVPGPPTGASFVGYSKFWQYYTSATGAGETPNPPPTAWTRAQYSYSTGLATAFSTTQVTFGGGTDLSTTSVRGGYFKFDADGSSAWRLISSVVSSAEVALSSAYPNSNGPLAFTIAIPMTTTTNVASGGVCTDFTRIEAPGVSSMFVVGAMGGRIMSGGSPPVLAQVTTDTAFYRSTACAWYASRMFVAPITTSTSLTEVSQTSIYGRVVWARSGSYTQFTGGTSGQADLEVGAIYWMQVLRDTLYVFGTKGIASVSRTGNSALPFRAQTLIKTGEIVGSHKPCAVNGEYLLVLTKSGLMRFDGTRLSALAAGSDEVFRGGIIPNLDDVTAVSYPSVMAYDSARRRVWLVQPSKTNGETVIFDTATSGWTRYAFSGSGVRYGLLEWTSSSGGVQKAEMLGWDADVLYAYDRTVTTDCVPSAATAISWYATSGILDTSSSRDKKSCNRIRITYEGTTSVQTINMTVALYIDGGTTAAYTGTFNTGTAAAGVVSNGYLTFAPITGQQFSVKISGSAAKQVKINQIGLSLVSRQEAKPT